MSEWAAKRFWSEVTIEEADGGFVVALDGRRVMTPGKLPLVMPTRALARAVAEEWRAVDGRIDPGRMPWTRSANSAVEKVTPQRRAVADHLAEYAETDLLSYRAAAPEVLVSRQREAWDPLLDWAEATHGGRLAVTAGVMPIAQPPEATEALARAARDLDPWELTAFHDLVTLGGSFVVALRVLADPDPAFAEEMWHATTIDQDWQAEEWGLDAEAARDAEARKAAFLHASAFLRAVREF